MAIGITEKLDLVLPVVLNANTNKKSYDFKAGLKKLLEKYRGLLASGFLAVLGQAEIYVSRRRVGVTEVLF